MKLFLKDLPRRTSKPRENCWDLRAKLRDPRRAGSGNSKPCAKTEVDLGSTDEKPAGLVY